MMVHLMTYERASFYVYGPTMYDIVARRPIGFIDYDYGRLISVEEVRRWKDESYRAKSYWEREAKPQHFFTKNLGRSLVQSGTRPDTGVRRERTAGEIYDEQMGEVPASPAGRSPDVDEAGGIV